MKVWMGVFLILICLSFSSSTFVSNEFLLAICVLGCGEPPSRYYNIRERRDKLSENIVVGMDYLGKPKIVCHCDASGVYKLQTRTMYGLCRYYTIFLGTADPGEMCMPPPKKLSMKYLVGVSSPVQSYYKTADIYDAQLAGNSEIIFPSL